MSIATFVDIGVILVLLISAGVSFFRGFIREVLTIFGVAGGAFSALMFGQSLKPIVRGWYGISEGTDPGKLFDLIPMTLAADVTAYAVIFLGVFILLQLISHFLAASAHALGLGPVDRTLGIFFGLARGVLLIGLLYLPFHLILSDDAKKEWLSGSKTYFYVQGVADWMSSYLPQDEDAKKTGEKIGEAARDKLREIDVLGDRRIAPEAKPQTADEPTAPQQPDAKDGYSNQDRGGMNQLLDTLKTGAGNDAAPAQPRTPEGRND